MGTVSIRDALSGASGKLVHSESPWLDAVVLLAALMGKSREKILASFPDPLDPGLSDAFDAMILKRRQGWPVAYLTGEKEFFGRPFRVREGVLCPRPDTEILVEEALKESAGRKYVRIHDLCTGSGCIAVSLALENPSFEVSASDISPVSEEVFKENCRILDCRAVPFTSCSLLEGISGPLDMIVSNPPYLKTAETEVRMARRWKEPPLALDGGEDGLGLIGKIIPSSVKLLRKGGMLMMEAAPGQMAAVKSLLENSAYSEIRVIKDLAGLDRVISGVRG